MKENALANLGKIEQARVLVRECRDASTVREIRDQAKAVETYQRERGAAMEVQLDAAEIALRAEIRLGEMLAATVSRGRPKKGSAADNFVGLDDFDVSRGQSSRWQRAATAPPELVDRYVEVVRSQGSAPSSTALADLAKIDHGDAAAIVESVWSGDAKDLRSALRAHSHKQRQVRFAEGSHDPGDPGELGRFGLIYIDPPWRYDDGTTDPTRAIESNYATMALGEIEALPVAELAADDCALAMWITSPMLFDSVSSNGEIIPGVVVPLLAAWGFHYRAAMVWDKVAKGPGYWWRVRHEILVLAIRGDVPTPAPAVRRDSIFREKRTGEHSRKPAGVREMLTEMFPGDVRRLEMFARGTAPPGWKFWGNQAHNESE